MAIWASGSRCLSLVVWTWPDGKTCIKAADSDGVLAQPSGQLMANVIADGPGLVALSLDGDSGGSVTAVWTSP